MNIQSLITDLAFILLLGAAVTLLFKWIRQPVVLGYIVAGFLASPHFTYIPSVTTEANIDFWAQIGIIVLLFSLGLEFSFKKLVNTGGSAVVTALIIVTGMMVLGFGIGNLLGFTSINSLFLGGMLSMSSTTIIIKAFNDMGLRQKKFASLVLAVLIVEDLFAVVMMVVLSSIAVNNSVEGGSLLISVGKLVFFLVIWFLVGVYVLPSMLHASRRFLNDETLLVVSMGLCLGMAVFSVVCGFSMALGAFVMGSILAGTIYAERIERVVAPVKDLFGSVFFISVGMMVQPAILAEYWGPILLLSAVVVGGMIVFGTFGMLVTGQTLRVAIQSGFSLTQIGEFAFIIANLGMALGVLAPTIYPIVVAVSVITTFTTPYFIKMSVPAYNLIERHLPSKWRFLIDRYQTEASKTQASTGTWRMALRRYIWRTVLYSVILTAIILVSQTALMPWMEGLSASWGRLSAVALTLGAMAPFLLALMLPVSSGGDQCRRLSPMAVVVMTIFRSLVALFFVVYFITAAYSSATGLSVGVAILLLLGMVVSKRLQARLTNIESKFMNNLNERELMRRGTNNRLVSDLHMAYMTVGAGCPFAGQRLMESNLRQRYGVNIVGIQRGGSYIAIPGARERVYPGDVLSVIGTDDQIERLLPVIDVEPAEPDIDIDPSDVRLASVLLTENSPLINETPRSASLRDKHAMVVVAVHRGDEFIDSNPALVFAPGDIVWAVGKPTEIARLG